MKRIVATWCMVGMLLSWGTAAGANVPEAVRVRQALGQTVHYFGLDDPKATLTDALDQIAKHPDIKALKVKFDINEKAFQEEDVPEVQKTELANPNPIPPKDASLDAVLRKLLSRVPAKSGATYVVRHDGIIEITTGEAVRREFYRRSVEGLDKPLPPLVIAVFEEKPLAEALRTLARQAHGNVVLDLRSVKDAAKAPVTAELINVPLDDAVRLLADLAGLHSVSVGRVLYVTTAENARRLAAEEEAREEKQGLGGRAPIRPIDPKKEKSFTPGDCPRK